MQRTLYTPNSVTGGATCIAIGLMGRNSVFIQNNDANNDAYLGHSRLDLVSPRPNGGQGGYKIAKASQQTIVDWNGDLWAAASADGTDVDIEVRFK